MPQVFFSDWSSTGRVVAVGVLAYAVLILVLRISGKRTLAKMNAFDLVVTVALGSALSSTLLSRTVPLVDGAVALSLLIALQFGVAWASLRARWFRKLVKSDPALLMRDGVFLDAVMRHERVDRDDVLCFWGFRVTEALSASRSRLTSQEPAPVARATAPAARRPAAADHPRSAAT